MQQSLNTTASWWAAARVCLLPCVLTAAVCAQSVRTTPHVLRDGSGALATRFAASFAPLGDVDGDGSTDLAVGIPEAAPGGSGSGAVELRNGFTGAVIWRVDGAAALEGLGSSVQVIGDVDADGLPDVAASRRPNTSPAGPLPDRFDVLSASSGAILFSVVLPTSEWASVPPSFAQVADRNGDGIDEVAVSSLLNTGADIARLRIVDVVTGLVLVERVIGGTAFFGPQAPAPVLPAADLNGDSVPDLVLGVPSATTPLLTLAAAGRLLALDGSNLATIWTLHGTSAFDNTGRAMAWIQDIDADGTSELLVGAPSFGNHGKGRVHVVAGASGNLLASLLPDAAWGVSRFGASLASLGPATSGAGMRVVVGALPDLATSSTFSTLGVEYAIGVGVTRKALLQARGAPTTAPLVAAAGDANGDGLVDIALGLCAVTSAGVEGALHLFRTRGVAPHGSGPPAVHSLVLDTTGPNQLAAVRITGGTPQALAGLAAGLAPASVPAFGGALLVSVGGASPALILPVPLGPAGSASLGIGALALDPSLFSRSFFLQAFELSGLAPQGVRLSDGLQITF